ncbi:MAG TPA: hypothetical protein VGP26_24450 [Actinophytocola sp.]|nr:hypothetical protein [Actinophytocola sp.]
MLTIDAIAHLATASGLDAVAIRSALLAHTTDGTTDGEDSEGFPVPARGQVKPDCLCVHTCADDPATACHLSGQWHTHPDEEGGFGPCLVHPDAPGDR